VNPVMFGRLQLVKDWGYSGNYSSGGGEAYTR